MGTNMVESAGIIERAKKGQLTEAEGMLIGQGGSGIDPLELPFMIAGGASGESTKCPDGCGQSCVMLPPTIGQPYFPGMEDPKDDKSIAEKLRDILVEIFDCEGEKGKIDTPNEKAAVLAFLSLILGNSNSSGKNKPDDGKVKPTGGSNGNTGVTVNVTVTVNENKQKQTQKAKDKDTTDDAISQMLDAALGLNPKPEEEAAGEETSVPAQTEGEVETPETADADDKKVLEEVA